MNRRIYYTLKKKWNIIEKITAAIEVPNTNGLRLLLIFFEMEE